MLIYRVPASIPTLSADKKLLCSELFLTREKFMYCRQIFFCIENSNFDDNDNSINDMNITIMSVNCTQI